MPDGGTKGRRGLKVPAGNGSPTCDQRMQILALFLLPLARTYTRPPAILVDELDAEAAEIPHQMLS